MKYIDAFLYILFTAISFVFLDKVISHISPVVTLTIMSACGIVVFNLFNIDKLIATYKFCLKNKVSFLIMSGALAIDWCTMVASTYFADPFVAMASLFIAVSFIGFFKEWLKSSNVGLLISCLLLTVASIIMILFYAVPVSKSIISGFILGATAGIAFYVYVYSSARLTLLGDLTAMQILATRFWVLFIGALVFVPYRELVSINIEDIGKIILVSFGSLIIPIYFNQKSIQKLGADKTSILIGLVPPITYLCYVIIYHNILVVNAVICLLITMALFIPKLVELAKR